MHALDSQAEDGEIGKPGVERRLGIALQIPRLARSASDRVRSRPPSVTRGWLSGSPRSRGAGQQQRARAGRGRGSWCGATASTSGTAARRRNRWRRRPAWSAARRPPPPSVASAPVRASRISRLASATASAWDCVRIGGGVRHGGLVASGGSRRQKARSGDPVKDADRRLARPPLGDRWPIDPTSW